MSPDEQIGLVPAALDASGLVCQQVGEQRWMTLLAGDWKRSIPVLLHLDEHSLRVSSLFCGAPDEGHAEVYALLLHRNEDARWVHFALDDAGDVVMVGRIPRAVLDAALLDVVLGELLAVSDATYNAALRAGFKTYIEAEQRWRAAVGLPPNPIAHN